MTSITLTAPAKVNIFLRVLNKREDSYHNIHTLFERISLADTVRISKRPSAGIEVVSEPPVTRSPRDNIAYRAAASVIKKYGLRQGVRIRIRKRIPVAAGLGGGSSDAAAVLLGMNRLFRLAAGRRTLMRIAAKIGSDVPFFVLEEPFAIGRGRGERLQAVKSRKRFWHVVVKAGFKLSTKDIYRSYDTSTRLGIDPEQRRRIDASDFALTRHAGGAKIGLHLKKALDIGALRSMLHNNLEDTVVAKKKAVGVIIRRLASLSGGRAIVSGSGPSVFCLCSTRKEALKISRLLTGGRKAGRKTMAGRQVFIARTF